MPTEGTDRPELDGRVIVVTGAGRGVGAATVLTCARLGARVVAADIDRDGIDAVASQGRDLGYHVRAVPVDVTDEESVEDLVAAAVETFGRLDGFVNNAATMVVGSAAELSSPGWDRTFAVNAQGVFFGCKHAIRRFLDQGSGGSIVNVASISALVGLPGQIAYCASKGAVLQLTRQVAADYAASGIRCNSVGPGSIDGEFLTSYLDGLPDPEAARARIIAAHPIGRLARASEIAEPIAFLLSARASFISGANLQVDGGYTSI